MPLTYVTKREKERLIILICICLGGKNVAELRDATGVKAGVSKVVAGVHDRVLTINGTLEGVAKVIQ